MNARARVVVRALILIHRYLGIGLGVLMALWCLSGIVMMYVPYPMILDSERVAALPPIKWAGCCKLDGADAPAAAERIASFQLEVLGDVPVLRLSFAAGESRLVDLFTGKALDVLTPEQAWSAAAHFGAHHDLSMRQATQDLIEYDEWTVGGFRKDRPLHHIAFHDAHGTEVYVSGTTGKVVQLTTASQRFWSWLGAVPHWLYPSILRSHPQVWAQVVVWTSLLGAFLTVTGLYIGISQLRRRAIDRALASPYRGILYWHHVPGLIFGVFAFTWVLSGLLSMNPWGLLESDGFGEARQGIEGEPATWEQVRTLLESLPRNAPNGMVSVQSAPLGGKLFAISAAADATRRRFGPDGASARLSPREIETAARSLATSGAASSWQVLTREDAYHYSLGRQYAQLPAIRIAAGSPQPVFYYLDATSGELIDMADSSGRAYRWWHSGLHRLDFIQPLRTSLARNLLMLPLLAGAALVCVLGAYLGLRRALR